MRFMAAATTAVTVYLAVGIFTGYTTSIRRRPRPRSDPARYRLWLTQAGCDLDPARFGLGCAAIGLLALFLMTAATEVWWLAMAPAAGAALTPFIFYARRRRERLSAIRDAWPDALREVLAAISAGATLTAALASLAERGPVPLRRAFGRYRLLSRMMGAVPALEIIKEELGDPNSDRVLEVLVLAYERGGPLVSEVIRNLIDELTEDLRLAAEIRSAGTEQRIESWVVVVIPWALLLFLTQTSAQYQAFYRSGTGLLVVMAGMVWSLVGVGLLRYLSRSSTEPRVLTGARVPQDQQATP